MPKIHHIRLSDDERADLEALIARRSENAAPVKRALMLLALDYVESMSTESVRRLLSKTRSSRGVSASG